MVIVNNEIFLIDNGDCLEFGEIRRVYSYVNYNNTEHEVVNESTDNRGF
jgi:hypothetical protein